MNKRIKGLLCVALVVFSLIASAETCKENYARDPLPSAPSKGLDFGHKKFEQTLKNHSK